MAGIKLTGSTILTPGRPALDARPSVSVAMTQQPVVLDASAVAYRADLLTDTLRRNARIVVDGTSFAPVTVIGHAAFA